MRMTNKEVLKPKNPLGPQYLQGISSKLSPSIPCGDFIFLRREAGLDSTQQLARELPYPELEYP